MSPAAAPSTPANDTPARTVARAILSTLGAPSAVFALATVATFARAIVDAAALLRQCSGDAAEATARAMLAGGLDAFDTRAPGADASTHTYALAAAWWFETPCDIAATFWRDDIARANVEAQARAALVDVEALRVELGREALPVAAPAASDASLVYLARSVDPTSEGAMRALLRAYRVADDTTAAEVLPYVLAALNEGVEGLKARRAVEARASNDGGELLPRVARVLYMTEPAAPGHTAIASGLAALAAGYATGEDATALVRGLAALAAHRAGEADDCRTVDGATAALAATLDALDAAALVGRSTLAAFDAAPPTAPPHSVEVRAA